MFSSLYHTSAQKHRLWANVSLKAAFLVTPGLCSSKVSCVVDMFRGGASLYPDEVALVAEAAKAFPGL